MTGLEWDNFHKLDREEYIIMKNEEFLKYYRKNLEEGYNPILNLKEMQVLINEITKFFEFKYPEEMLNGIYHQSKEDQDTFNKCLKIAKELDMNQLKYRLYHDQVSFLECSYAQYIQLKRNQKKLYETSFCDIRVDFEGKVEHYDLEALKSENFLEDIEGINRVEDLLGRYLGIETAIDYSNLEKAVKNHKISVSLRNKVLELTMLSLLYSNNAHPRNGYLRAKRFMRMFNKEYNLDLNMEKLDDIMSVDYSNTEEVKQKIKERKR